MKKSGGYGEEVVQHTIKQECDGIISESKFHQLFCLFDEKEPFPKITFELNGLYMRFSALFKHTFGEATETL